MSRSGDEWRSVGALLRHFPNEQAAMKVLYLVAAERRPNREDLTGRTNGWKTILNTLTIHYGDRINGAI